MENRTENRIKFFAKSARENSGKGGGSEKKVGRGGWKEILKTEKSEKHLHSVSTKYYKQVAGRQRQTKENPGVAKFGIALEWVQEALSSISTLRTIKKT